MGGRGVIRLKYVHAFRDRTGRMRYYFRRHGKRNPLPGLPGSSEFMAAYAAQLNNPPKQGVQRPTAAPGTFAALAIRYYGSPQYLRLSTSSRNNYRRVIDGFLAQHGHRRVDQMAREHVDVVIGKMADKPGAGIILLKRIRTLIRYAMALGWTDRDPTAGVKGYRSKEFHTWSEDEIAAFRKYWPEGSRIIPIHEDLHRVLGLATRGDATILLTAYDEAFSLKGFGNMISRAIRKAGLPARCEAHGLRKAAARRLAEAGCSASEIAAITGHKTLAEVERYTRAADQERLARRAIQRQSENRSGKLPVEEVANTTDNTKKINSLISKLALPGEG
jgi:hypothetical protein